MTAKKQLQATVVSSGFLWFYNKDLIVECRKNEAEQEN